jgi:hypothetical protein
MSSSGSARSDSSVQGRGSQGAPQRVDTIFNRLFEEIALTPDQSARARDILARLYQEQLRQDSVERLALVAKNAKAIMTRMQRDSALRALLTNDTDRSTFDAHASNARGGPRSGGAGRVSLAAGLDSLAAALPGGRAGGGGRGRAGGRGGTDTLAGRDAFRFDTLAMREFVFRAEGRGGRAGGGRGAFTRGDSTVWYRLEARNVMLDSLMTTMTFNRLFDGITLTPDQASRARELIAQAQRDMGGNRRSPPPRLRMNPSGIVSMPATSADALAALVANEADRAKLQSRINKIP